MQITGMLAVVRLSWFRAGRSGLGPLAILSQEFSPGFFSHSSQKPEIISSTLLQVVSNCSSPLGFDRVVRVRVEHGNGNICWELMEGGIAYLKGALPPAVWSSTLASEPLPTSEEEEEELLCSFFPVGS